MQEFYSFCIWSHNAAFIDLVCFKSCLKRPYQIPWWGSFSEQNVQLNHPIYWYLAWAMFTEIGLSRSVTQPLASSREFSWRCSLSTPVVDSHRCCWLITFSSRPRVRNCLHFINLLTVVDRLNFKKKSTFFYKICIWLQFHA